MREVKNELQRGLLNLGIVLVSVSVSIPLLVCLGVVGAARLHLLVPEGKQYAGEREIRTYIISVVVVVVLII